MRILLTVCLTFILTSSVHSIAESAPPFDIGPEWTYEQACLAVDNPGETIQNWDGTIVTRGHFGFHGINADWQTPRVLAFMRSIPPSDELIVRSLSPGANWYVRVVGDRECSTGWGGCTNTYNYAWKISIFNLSWRNHQHITIPWKFIELAHHTGYNITRPTWIDETHFVYPFLDDRRGVSNSGEYTAVVNVLDGSVERWPDSSLDVVQPTQVSPDRTRKLVLEYAQSDQQSHDQLIQVESGEVIATLGGWNFEPLPEETASIWSPDSFYFLATQKLDTEDVLNKQLWLYDRNGNVVSHILTASEKSFGALFSFFLWSPNGNKILLSVIMPVDDPTPALVSSTMHLIDIDHRRIVDLCLSPYQRLAWSPDGDQIATIQDGHLALFDVELNRWQVSERIYGDYTVFGWRASE